MLKEIISEYVQSAKPTLEYIVFSVGEQFYGVDIVGVQEIRRYSNFTPVYNVPSVKGLINLRGQAVTVIDLRKKLRQKTDGVDENKPLIIVTYKNECVALLVDGISDAVYITKEQILLPPSNIKNPEKQFITGVYRNGNNVVIILDKNMLLSSSLKKEMSDNNETDQSSYR